MSAVKPIPRRISSLLRCGRNLRPHQFSGFRLVEAKQEIFRKSGGIARDLFVEALCRDAVDRRKVVIEDDPASAEEPDDAGNFAFRIRLGRSHQR
jgi:hypothetical protein